MSGQVQIDDFHNDDPNNKSADLGCLKPSEHQGDYEVNRELFNQIKN